MGFASNARQIRTAEDKILEMPGCFWLFCFVLFFTATPRRSVVKGAPETRVEGLKLDIGP